MIARICYGTLSDGRETDDTDIFIVTGARLRFHALMQKGRRRGVGVIHRQFRHFGRDAAANAARTIQLDESRLPESTVAVSSTMLNVALCNR